MTKEKKLYVSISAGEENYYFTKDEGLQLLSSEFNRVEQEKGEKEMPYEWEFVWLTDEEYAEMSSDPDKPDFLTPSGDVKEQIEAYIKKNEADGVGPELRDAIHFGMNLAGASSMQAENERLRELLQEYGDWEADIISENKLWWPHSAQDVMRGHIYDKMIELQGKRNKALNKQ